LGLQLRKTRLLARLGRRAWVAAVLAAVLASALLATSYARSGRSAISRSSAAAAALKALGVQGRHSAEIVFGLDGTLPAGTVIRAGGPATPAAGGAVKSSPSTPVLTARHAAWFFYDDGAPFEQYEHPGRVALVDAQTGKVSLSRTLEWPPLIGGRVPAFLQSADAYDSPANQVFYRPYGSSIDAADAAPRIHPALDHGQAARVAALLAAEHSCVIRAGNTLTGGGYYGFANISQSRAALEYRFDQLASLNHGIGTGIYLTRSGLTPAAFIARQIASRGCRDLMLYVAGGGYAHQTAVNLGMQPAGTRVQHQDLTYGDLFSLIRSHPSVTFKLVIDAPYAVGFDRLAVLSNVALVATPVALGGGSITYLPAVQRGTRTIVNNTNPLKLLQFTDRLAFGLDQAIDDPCEVRAAAGKSSALAYLLARGFARGGAVDFAAQTGVGGAPSVLTNGFTAGAPRCGPPTVTANNDSYAAGNDHVLSVDTSHGVLANDSDSAQDPLAVDQLNGSATLHGSSSKGATVSINADGSFTYDPSSSPQLQSLPLGQQASDSFTYRANDGHGGSASATVTITVTSAVNQPPVLANIEQTPLSYTAGRPGVAVSSSITVSDPDSTTLAGATVTISSGFSASEDSLGFAKQNGISGSYDSTTGVLTLSGTASLADYQTALRSITYADSNGTTPSTTTRTISFQVDDGAASNHLSNTVSRDVSIAPNQAPSASDDAASTSETSPTDISVLANDSDSDGDSLQVASADTTGTKGSVSINPDGTIHYDPNGQFASLQEGQTATDTFTYKASDGFFDSNAATVTVTINGANTAPTLSNIEATPLAFQGGDPGAPITSTLTISDPDDTILAGGTVSITSGFNASEDSLGFVNQNGITGSYDPSTGVLTMTGSASIADYQTALRSVTYADSNGADPSTATRTISFQVDDGHPSNHLSNTTTRDVQVSANPSPSTAADTATTTEKAATDINVLANDSDSDGDTLSVASIDTTGTQGSVSINPNGTIHYDPNGKFDYLNAGQTATDTFTYKASDGFTDSAATTVTVTITGVNDAPVLSGIEAAPINYRAGDPAVTLTSTLAISDPDDTTLASATVSISAGFSASEDSLAFTNQNGISGNYDSSTGVLKLTGTASIASYQAALRSITYSDSNAVSPSTATRTFSFQVDDGQASNHSSNTVSRDVSVTANSAPVASDDTASTDQNTATDINVLANDSDSDGDTLSVASIDTTGTKGSVSINPDGTIHYDPNGQFNYLQAGETATDSFTYKANDGFQDSASATVTVTVTGLNDAPVISGVEDAALFYSASSPAAVSAGLTISDADDTNLASATVKITSGFNAAEDSLGFSDQGGITGHYDPSTGTLALSGSASVATYQAALRSVTYADSSALTPDTTNRVISFQVDDGHALDHSSNVASRDVSVHANSAPVANDDSASTDQNTATDITVLANDSDADGDTLSVASIDTTGTQGAVSINPDGTIHYDPNGQFNYLQGGQTATDTFTYKASDGFQDSGSATVTVTITGVDDAPTLTGIESSALSYRAQDPAVAITSSVTAGDVDDTNLSGATVIISSGLESANDFLHFTTQNGISGSYTSGTGSLTLSGTATLAQYTAALESVTFSTADGSANPGNRTISFQVSDPHGVWSTAVSRTISITPANQPPVPGTNNFTSVIGNTTFGFGTSPSAPAVTATGSLLDNATDPDSPHANLSVTSNGTPSHGSVTVSSDGTFTYLPAAGYTGSDSFTYTISDNDPSNPKTATGTVNLTVGPLVWYVNNNASAGDGRSSSPFSSLSAAATRTGTNDYLFLYHGTGTYSGNVAMKSGEKLIGQSDGLTVGTVQLVSASGTNPAITNSSGDGIDLAEGASVAGVDVSSASANGIAASGVNSATINSDVTVGSAGGSALSISAGSGTISSAATITSGSGKAVSVSGRTGGTVSVTGAVTNTTGSGISLTNNTGATINFSGALSLSTGANTAFAATGGGTVSSSNSASTLTTTTARALDVANTTIGGAGLVFKSISAGTNSGGPDRGISLVSTGSSGSLSVTGTGSAGTGGTIQKTTSTGSISSGAGNGGVYLSSTSSPTLKFMNVTGNNSSGIYGTSVSGLTLDHDSITSNGTNNANDDDGLRIDDLSGTASITNSTISGSAESDARLVGSSSPLTLTVSADTFSSAAKGNGLVIVPQGGSVSPTITGSVFTGNFSDGLGVISHGAGTVTTVAKNNTVTNNTGAGIDIGSSGSTAPPGSFTIDSNTLTGQQGDAISVANLGNGTWQGHVTNNTIGNAGTPFSGSTAAAGVNVRQEGSGTLTADVSNNNVRQIKSSYGIMGDAGNGSGTLNLTLNSNNVDTNQTTSLDGITVNSGTNPGDTATVCVNATNNISASEGTQAANGLFDAAGMSVVLNISTTAFKIQGLTGSGADDVNVSSFLGTHPAAPNNTLSGPGALANGAFAQHNTTGFTSASACPTASPGPAADVAGRPIITPARHLAAQHRGHRHGKRGNQRKARHRLTVAERVAAARRARAILHVWRPAWMRTRR
jgi:VCBS repeat-containing protein